MLKLRDREQLHKDRDRDFPKRRRVDDRSLLQQRSGCSYRENLSTDSSDEELFEEEEEARIRHQNRMKQSLTNNRGALRSLRSSPVLRAAGDEVLGVLIPRRARSAPAKKLNKYRDSGNGGFGEDLSHGEFSTSPATVNPIDSGDMCPASSGASLKKKKKMKYVESGTRILSSPSNSRPSSMIQDDIEIEVAEALFDLMKQSHSQSQTFEREEKYDRVSTNTDRDDLKILKAEREKDDNDVFQNEQSIKGNAETIIADSARELNKGGRIEKEDFPDDPAQELVAGDWFVDNGKMGSPRESESPSCVKLNDCDIQDPTVTNADCAVSVIEAKEARIEIDLMALPFLPPSPERDPVLDVDSKVRTLNVPKKSETTPKDGSRLPAEKIGVISDNQLLDLNLEKQVHYISSVSQSISQQPSGSKEPKNQSPTSLLSFPIGMGSWPGVLPHPGYIQSQRAVLSTDGSARSSIMQPPRFKFSQPRRKRCATHKYIAGNIHNHQQLLEKSLSSGTTGAAILDGTKPPSFKSMLPTQRFVTGNPLLGDFEGGRSSTISATIRKSVLEQALNQTPASNFLHHPGSTFPLGHHHQTTTMAPSNSSGPPHQSASAINNASLPSNNNSSRKLSSNSSFPETSSSTAVTFNHSTFPSDEAAASYMAILQKSGYPFLIPTNISLPSSKGGSLFLNSSFYSPPVFNISRNQDMLYFPSQKSHPSTSAKTSDNNSNNTAQTYSFPAESIKYLGSVGNNNNIKHGDIPQPFPLSLGLNGSSHASSSSMAQNLPIFQMLPETPWNGIKNFPTSAEKSQTPGGQSLSSSAMACSKFDNKSQSTGFLPSIPNYYHLHHQTQTQQLKASSIQTDRSSFLPKWDNFPRATTAPEGSSSQPLVNIPQLKNSEVQNHVAFSNSINQPVSSLTVGQSSNSSNLKNTINGQRKASLEMDGSQKSSPACRRIVPPILSACGGQLSELKY